MEDVSDYSALEQTIALTRYANVKPRLFDALLRHYGGLSRVLAADSGSLMAIPGISTDAANAVADAASSLEDAKTFVSLMANDQVELLSRFDAKYPQQLLELNDPPPLLFSRGELPDPKRKLVTIAGSRSADNLGMELAAELTRRFLQKDVQIIASLEPGTATTAHLTCRAAERSSFAVLHSGFDALDPTTEQPLAEDIALTGGLISEWAPSDEIDETAVSAGNRLLASLGQAVVITEVYNDSTQVLDLLECCGQIGKLVFVMIDPEHGAMADVDGLNKALAAGAIPMVGWEKVDEITRALV